MGSEAAGFQQGSGDVGGEVAEAGQSRAGVPGRPLNLLCLSSWVERSFGSVELAIDLAGEVALQSPKSSRCRRG